MKLHLPTRLRAAVLACFAVVTSFTTTLATGAIAGGAFALAIAGSQALAAYDEATATITGTSSAGAGGIVMGNLTVPDGQTLTFAINQDTRQTYFNGTQTYAGDIIIKNTAEEGEPATGMVINDGNAGNIITFTGAVTGDGIIYRKNAGRANTWEFLGDAHLYTGAIKMESSVDNFKIKFGTTNNSTATQGVSGTGDITFASDKNSIIYDYSGGQTVYVTNTISVSENNTSRVVLMGTDAVEFTKTVTIHELCGEYTSGDYATYPTGTANASKITFKGAGSTLGKSGKTNDITSTLEVAQGAGLTLAGTMNFASLGDTPRVTGSGSVTIADGFVMELGADFTPELNKEYKLFADTLTLTGWEDLTMSGFVKGGRSLIRSQMEMTATGFKFTAVGSNYTDMSTAGTQNWNYTDAVWNTAQDSSDSPIAFAYGDSAVLSSNADFTLQNDGIVARSVIISGEGTNVSLSNGYLKVEEGLEVQNGATLNVNSSYGNGASGGYIQGTVTVKNGGTLKLNSHDVTGWSGSSRLSVLTIEEGGKLVLSFGSNHETFQGTLNLDGSIEDDAEESGVGAWYMHGVNSTIVTGNNKNASISSNLKLGRNDAPITVGTDSTLTVSGALVKNEGNGIIVKNGVGELRITTSTHPNSIGYKVGGGTLTFTNGVSVGAIEMSGGDTNLLFAGEGKTYSTSAISTTGEDSNNRNISVINELNVSGYSSIAAYTNFLSGTINLNGNSGYFNRTTIDGGTLNIVGAFRSNTNGAIYVNSGALNLKSTATSPSDDPEQNFNNTIQILHVAEGAAVTVDTGAVATIASATIAAPIVNKGNLTLSGTLTVSDLSAFAPIAEGGGSPTYVDAEGNPAENGYLSGTRVYTLIENTGTLNDDAITSVSGVTGTYEDGVLTVTGADESIFYVNTTVDAAALGAGKKYRINSGILNVGTDAANILTTAVGDDGIIKLTTNATLGNGTVTVAGCKLAISDATLTMGSNKTHVVDISSFSSMELDNATIAYHGANTTFKNVEVTSKGANIDIADMKGDYGACDTMTLAGTTMLSEKGTLAIKSTDWKYKVNIEALTGGGDISMASSSTHDNAAVLTIDSFSAEVNSVPTSFGGAITVTKNTGAATLNATIDCAVSSKGLNLVNGAVANMAIQTGGSWSGAVNVTGTGNSLTSTAGGMNLSQLNVAEGAALGLNGAVSALLMNQAGTVDTAGMLLTDGAVLTYGNAANLLSVADGMLAGNVVIGSGLTLTDDGVNLGLSSAIAQEKIGISNYANSALLVVGDTWHLKSVPLPKVRYYWEGEDNDFFADPNKSAWSTTDNDKSNLVQLPDALDNVVLVFSDEGTEASPNTMKLNGDKTVHSVEVSNGYYEFANAGKITCTELDLLTDGHLLLNKPMTVGQLSMAANSSLSINSALTIAEGGKVTVTGAGAVINQGRGDQPQSLSTSALEITGDGSSLSIVGLANSKSATTLGAVTMGDNTTLTLKDGATDIVATATALSLGSNASIVLEANQVLDLTPMYTKTAFVQTVNNTSGDGTVRLAGGSGFESGANHRVDMRNIGNGGTVTTAVNYQINGNFILNSWVSDNSPAVLLDIKKDFAVTGEFRLETNTGVTVSGGTLCADSIGLGHHDGNDTVSLTLNGAGSISTDAIRNTAAGNHSFTMSGNSTLTISSADGIANGISTTITGGTLVASEASGWGMTSASVGGAVVSADSTGKVTMTNTTITGNITGNDKLVLAGTVNATANATVSGASVREITVTTTDTNKLTLNNTTIDSIITNNGTLEFSGTQNVTLPASFVDKYADVYGSNTYGDNGYKSTEDVYTLVSGKDATAAAGTIWQVNGAALSGTPVFDGKILTQITADTAGKVYYINSDRVVYEDGAGCEEAVQLQLTGGKLVMSQELDSTVTTGGIAVTGSSTTLELNAELDAENVSMGTGAATVLMGNGTLNLGTGTALASGISLGTETDARWTGTVKVTGAALSDADLSGLGIAGSTIELNDTDGTLKDGTYVAGVKLTNGSDVSLGANNNFSTLDATDGNLSISGMGNSISTLTLADNATLGMNMADISLGSLMDLGPDALLTVGTLNADTPGGALTLAVNVSEDLLLTMSHGQSILLADIGICDADTTMGLMVGGQPAVTELEVTGSNGVSYLYALNKDNSTGHTYITVAARMIQEGWIGDESDIWTTADTIDGMDSNWDKTVGLFCGYGSGTVNIDTAGVDASGKTVMASATEHTTDYTFEGGALVADKLVVNAGSLIINNAGVETLSTTMVSDQGSLTVGIGKTLTVGTDMAVLNEAVFTNKGETTVTGTLSVAKDATVTNSRNLSVGGISAEEATISSTGQLTVGATGGTIGALTGNGYLNNNGKLTIKSDTDLQTLTNAGTLTVEGALNVTATATGGVIQAASANLGYAKLDELQVTGSVTAKDLTVGKATMQSLTADKLASLSGDAVIVKEDATLGTFSVNGVLEVGAGLTVTGAVESEGEILAASADLQGDATLDTLKVTGELKATNLTVTNLATASLDAVSLTIEDGGTGTVQSGVTLEKFSGSGSFTVQGDLTVNSSVAQGGTVQADNITVAGSAVFNDVTTGSLTAAAVSLTNGSITTLNTTNLTVHGTASVTDDVSLTSLGGTGTLQVGNKLTLTEQITSSAHVAAGILELQATGSTLGSVLADTLTMAEGLTLSMSDALLTVDGFGTLNDSTVAISLSESVFSALDKEASGLYSIADYLIIDGVASADIFNLTDCAGLDALRAAGRDASLSVSKGKLYLSITAAMDENGEEIGLVWDATGGNTTTSTGSDIDTEEGFYKALDYVQQVLVKDDVTFDLSAGAVGDSEPGNVSKPELGLTVRNLRGGGELTIKGNSAEQDVATLFNTDGKVTTAAEAVALTVDATRVNLGLPTGSKGIMDDDLGAESPTLASLALVNGAQVAVNADTEVLGDTDLADTSALQVAEGSILTTYMLSGTDKASVSGVIRVTKGGVYTGSGEGAEIIAGGGSDLRLRTGGRKGMSMLAESGSKVTLDSAGQDGSMKSLRVGGASVARAAGASALNLLNTTTTDKGIVHNILSLTDTEGNYISNTAVTLSLGLAETAQTLGTADAPVVIAGAADVTGSTITVNMLANGVKNGALDIATDALTDLKLAQLVTGGTVNGNSVVLTGTPEMQALMAKYYTNARLDKSGAITVDRVTDYYSSTPELSENAQVGTAMADMALLQVNPQVNRSEYKDLAGVLDALDDAVVSGNSAAVDSLGAAVSGVSVAALGAAVAGDVERQLMAIRNRTTTMGVDQTGPNLEMPYFNAWINAEGDFRRMDEDGTAAGYELNSWGGTVGFDVDISPNFTAGLAATAMYGDFTAKSADHAEGDMDTYYLTTFARFAAHRWSHTFVATVGMADTSLKRTVAHANGSYSAEGDTDALSFGFLYEVGYIAAMNESATACLQPVFNVMLSHSSLNGYEETGSDAALTTGDVEMTTVTFGLGARTQAQVGTGTLNRASLLEGRALIKLRAGDREAEAENALGMIPGATGSVVGAEKGVIGMELGVGLTVPVGSEGGSVFADASLEVGGGYTNINGTIGYRINF